MMEENKKIEPLKPPLLFNVKNEERRVGFELELAGLELYDIAKIITENYGGKTVRINPYKFQVIDTSLGNFGLELDLLLLNNMVHQKYFEELGIANQELQDSVENLILKLAKTFIPYEIVFPPIRISSIEKAESLREALYKEKAVGTRSSVIYAFGLHINPEVPSFEVQTILDYLRAFLLLYDWLEKRTQVNITRKITPFINPFPKEYSYLVLEKNYMPKLGGLIDDYLNFNHDRNRPLDLLPLFSFLDKDRVLAKSGNKSVKARPAFHYRLPNSLVDDPNWSITKEWNLWIEVERLACDSEKISNMSAEYLDRIASPK